MNDAVEHPSHYCSHKSGVECIEISEHMNFCLGNAMKYVWRAGLKEDGDEIQDLKKAIWYINREISRREREITKKCLMTMEDRNSGKMPSAKRMDETLVHELTHGILYEMGLESLAYDEQFVTKFAKLFNNAVYSLEY